MTSNKYITRTLLVMILMLTIGIFSSCTRPSKGDRVVITKSLYGAEDEIRHDVLDKYLRQGNSSMVKIMVNAGTVKKLKPGDKGKVLDHSSSRYEILFDNPDIGTLWVEGHAVDKD